MIRSVRLWRLAALLFALCAMLGGCKAPDAPREAVVRLDGEEWAGSVLSPGAAEDLRVCVTLDGAPLIDLPFSEAHAIDILLPDGGENHIACTGESVFMADANCENHDCVEMGAVTRDNLETRVMGGFIICLPHRISVEVRGQ